MKANSIVSCLGLMLFAASGCEFKVGDVDDDAGGGDSDADTDTDSDADSDSDSDSDTDTDTDADTDTDTDTDADTDTDTDTDADTDTDSAYELGECFDSKECPHGDCVRVPDEPGGFWTCVIPIEEAQGPSSASSEDECLDAIDCADQGTNCGCYLETFLIGASMERNMCVCDECQEDGDCQAEGARCFPGGAWGQPKNTCLYSDCSVDGECEAAAGGHCIPWYDYCASDGTIKGKYCHYTDDPCLTSEDCTDTEGENWCTPDPAKTGFTCDTLMCPV